MPLYAQLIFALTAVNYFLIAFFFYRTQNGRLRIWLIAFFTVLGIASSLRCFERYAGPFLDQTTMAFIIGLPLLIMTSGLARFLYHYPK